MGRWLKREVIIIKRGFEHLELHIISLLVIVLFTGVGVMAIHPSAWWFCILSTLYLVRSILTMSYMEHINRPEYFVKSLMYERIVERHRLYLKVIGDRFYE